MLAQALTFGGGPAAALESILQVITVHSYLLADIEFAVWMAVLLTHSLTHSLRLARSPTRPPTYSLILCLTQTLLSCSPNYQDAHCRLARQTASC